MEDELSSDASIGLKRIITQLVSPMDGDGEEGQQHNQQQMHLEQDSSFLSPEGKKSPLIISTMKKEGAISEVRFSAEQSTDSFQKKAKWSPRQSVSDSQENQEIVKKGELKEPYCGNLAVDEKFEKGASDYGIPGDAREEVSEELLNFSGDYRIVHVGPGKSGVDFGILGDVREEDSLKLLTVPVINGVAEVESGKNGSIEEGFDKVMKIDEEVLKDEKNDGSLTCSLMIEVIDDTAVVDVSKSAAQNSEGINGKNVGKKELDAKNGKRSRRRAKSGRKGLEFSGNFSSLRGEGLKMAYTREELEALRYINVKGQKKMWQGIYSGFADHLRREYDGLNSLRQQKRDLLCFDPNQAAGTKNYCPGILGDTSSHSVNYDVEPMSSADYVCDDVDGNYAVGECSEDQGSDDDYESIQRPAFLVEGEPNLDSGPPEDGLEYLRRVRWEAAQIPKVKVAKLDKSKLKKEQSIYMPQIPDIEKCPEHLVPLKRWEDNFLADFSELRTVLYELESSSCSGEGEPANPEEVFSSVVFCAAQSMTVVGDVNDLADAPTVSAVLGMDPVTRAAMLKRRISMFEGASSFSKNDCAWLFALCAVVDTPLDADTGAALRCLLRKCAKLRAGKSELDDEVVMLNILATISGKYFGQLEN